MASEWQETTLGDVVYFTSGGTPSKENGRYWGGSTPWVSAKDMKRRFLDDAQDHVTAEGLANGTRLAAPGSVLVLTRGMTLLNDVPICVARKPLAFNQDVKALRAKDALDDKYLPYLLLGNKPTLLSMVDLAGHGTGRLNTGELRSLVVALPPKPEQRAIAEILGPLDYKIELNSRMSEALESMARALFRSWFVDFDPVRAKAKGRDPGLPPGVAGLFPDSFRDSELGEVPRGWGVAPLGELVDVVRGLSYKGSGLSDTGVPLHNLNSVFEGGGYKTEGLKHYTGEFKAHHNACAGDVLVANTEQGHDRRLIGYAAVVPGGFGGTGLFSHHLYRVRPLQAAGVTREYLVYLLNTPVMHDTVSGYANGTTVNMLPADGLLTPDVVVPPAAVVLAFDEFARASRTRLEGLHEESRTLAALRDALLPKLISGELRVGEAEQVDTHSVEAT